MTRLTSSSQARSHHHTFLPCPPQVVDCGIFEIISAGVTEYTDIMQAGGGEGEGGREEGDITDITQAGEGGGKGGGNYRHNAGEGGGRAVCEGDWTRNNRIGRQHQAGKM